MEKDWDPLQEQGLANHEPKLAVERHWVVGQLARIDDEQLAPLFGCCRRVSTTGGRYRVPHTRW